ncbi:MAG: FAD-linked oxidase C-terminal domain-containing protein [Chitinophagales bacterium]
MPNLEQLKAGFEGELLSDHSSRSIYATDASVYRKIPLAVAIPRSDSDIKKLIQFASEENIGLIPRTAGTSLGGQCVGDGIVVDTSQYFNKIIELNKEENWITVQPGVIRDELNLHLQPHGLFFGPNTSTANRAMIGGMTGNNSSGSYSIVYGTTREHVLEITGYLSDGSKVTFNPCDAENLEEKIQQDNLEGEIYRQLNEILSDKDNQKRIAENYPKSSIHRRNTGYALDMLLQHQPFNTNGEAFNVCSLLCGSEGTLMLITEIKLKLVPLPPSHAALLCVHFDSLQESLEAVVEIMPHQPRALELMDKFIMDCTKENIEHRKNRFFIQGDPEAVLIVEMGADSKTELHNKINTLSDSLKSAGRGYAYPVIEGAEAKRVWELRKAGLGLLSNMKGDAKPVAVIEDTAVDYRELPQYISEFTAMMQKYNQKAVYYAHAGAGELHLRPILNLKDPEHRKDFRRIAEDTARLVKKYKGALSGEHGDGRVRAEFIPKMIGAENYQLLRDIKKLWDPKNIFNPGKITDALPMDEDLRYEAGQQTPKFNTKFTFSDAGGFVRAAEKCNGSGDCRKLAIAGGTMCPSYMATRNEKDTTRARANLLRELIGRSTNFEKAFDQPEAKKILDLCMSCKGCASECPSNVDMSKLKSEFQYQYRKHHSGNFGDWAMAHISMLNKIGSIFPALSNFALKAPLLSDAMKKLMNVHPKRTMPEISKITLRNFYKNYRQIPGTGTFKKSVYLFADEFTNYNDAHVGITSIKLLNALGYKVLIPEHEASGRAFISKGYLDKAIYCAEKNVQMFSPIVNSETPLLGIEPSAILTFKDEYPELLRGKNQEKAKALAENVSLIDDFIAAEFEQGNFSEKLFTKNHRKIVLHGHCHQKALNGIEGTKKILGLPENYSLEVLPTGCCGMAGSFGYESEHFDISIKIAGLVLFSEIERLGDDCIIAAGGTSCRHQIKDGIRKTALHPVEILFQALLEQKELT